MEVLAFHDLEYLFPSPSCLQGFFWEISWQSYRNSFVGKCLAAFKIVSLSLILGKVNMMCLHVYFPGSNFFETLWASWKSVSFARLGKFLFIVCSNKFWICCFSFSSFWNPYDSDVGTFKVTPVVPKPVLIFLNSRFFILFWLKVYFFLLVLIIDLSPGFLAFTIGSLYISLHFTLHSLQPFPSILWPYSIISVSILITRVLNSASDRLAISSLLSCIFSRAFISFFLLDHNFFVSAFLSVK